MSKITVKNLPNSSWEIFQTYNNIEDFLSENKHRHSVYLNYNKYHKMKNLDVDYIYRAVYLKNIPPYKASKLDYQSFSEFKIHQLLLNLQKEFYIYDLRAYPIWLWFNIRLKNTIIKINQIRLRDFFFKPLSI